MADIPQANNENDGQSAPKQIVFGNLGGLEKLITNIIDKNKNQIPDFLEKLDIAKVKINGRTFSSWSEVAAEFKNLSSTAAPNAPLNISYDDKAITSDTQITGQAANRKSASPAWPGETKAIHVGGGFAFFKILLILAGLGIMAYYIYKLVS
ncbi:MAG: hypothetical protein ACOZBH_02125 [Patescibacteria group bacterium]